MHPAGISGQPTWAAALGIAFLAPDGAGESVALATPLS